MNKFEKYLQTVRVRPALEVLGGAVVAAAIGKKGYDMLQRQHFKDEVDLFTDNIALLENKAFENRYGTILRRLTAASIAHWNGATPDELIELSRATQQEAPKQALSHLFKKKILEVVEYKEGPRITVSGSFEQDLRNHGEDANALLQQAAAYQTELQRMPTEDSSSGNS